MHQDIEKLLNAAKEKGSITEKQREIILTKAQQLGEDMAELEFVLEDIPLKKNETTRVKAKRCSHCGAVVSDLEQVCPECGKSLSEEADATTRVRQIIKEISDKLDATTKNREGVKKDLEAAGNDDVEDWDIDEEIMKRKINIIHSFSVPYTSAALIQAYMFAYGNYTSESSDDDPYISKAWLGKAKEFYGLVQSIPNPDKETQLWLTTNSKIKKKEGRNVLTVGGWIGSILIIAGTFAALYMEWAYLSWASGWKILLSIYTLCMLGFVGLMPKKTV